MKKNLCMVERDLGKFNKLSNKKAKKLLFKGMKRRRLMLLCALSRKPLGKKKLVKVLGFKRARALKALKKARRLGLVKKTHINGKRKFKLTPRGKKLLAKRMKKVRARRMLLAKKMTSNLTKEERVELFVIMKKLLKAARRKRYLRAKTYMQFKKAFHKMPNKRRIQVAYGILGAAQRKRKMSKLLRNRKKMLMLFKLMKKGPIAKKKLHRAMGVKRAKMRKTLLRARRAGLVKVCVCHGRKRVVLTPKGRKLILRRIIKMSNRRAVRRAMVMRDIRRTLTKHEFRTFVRCLHKMKRNVRPNRRRKFVY